MNEALKEHLDAQIADIKAANLFKEERTITTPQGSRVGIGEGGEVLNMCANNYLGLADNPEIIEAARRSYDEWGFGLSSVRFICGTQQIHKGPRNAHLRVPRDRGHDPVFLLLRRQRRAVRNPAGRGGRGDQRRAQPRQHHRRHPPVQGAAPALQEQRHGGAGELPEGSGLGPLPADRHRRRLLDGRVLREASRDLRPRRRARRPGDDRRLARRRVRRGERPRHARALRRGRPRRHHHRHPRQGAPAAPAAATPAAAGRSSPCCASARAPTCSPTPWPRASPRPR